jgi:drug/metabolite transporter (DMT)-like permease
MNNLVATVIFGLAASLCWGSGDFSGGMASRRISAASVVIAGYSVGLVVLVALALISHEQFPQWGDMLWGVVAGLIGVLGLLVFYTALASGKMGLAAPISGVLTAAIPVLFSAATAGLPNGVQIVGFVLALAATILISRHEGPLGKATGTPREVWLALIAGCCFGLFFILISRVSHSAVYWPLAGARLSSVASLLVFLVIRRQPIVSGIQQVAPLLVAAGILDALGNAFFVLAAHSGRLDVAAVLSSLYPAATVLLAALVLRERVRRVQVVGVLIALLAIPLISV